MKEDRSACFLREDEVPTEEDWKSRPSQNIAKVFTEVLSWPVDAAMLALHGCGGEDGCFQGFLSTLGIPFTHSGVTASAVAMEKDIAKLLYAAAGIRIPKGVTHLWDLCQAKRLTQVFVSASGSLEGKL